MKSPLLGFLLSLSKALHDFVISLFKNLGMIVGHVCITVKSYFILQYQYENQLFQLLGSEILFFEVPKVSSLCYFCYFIYGYFNFGFGSYHSHSCLALFFRKSVMHVQSCCFAYSFQPIAFLTYSLSSPLLYLKSQMLISLCCLIWLIINKPQPNL